MVKVSELIPLQKNAALDITTCTILQKDVNEQLNISKFVLEKDGKTFYRVEQDGNVKLCCEILAHWKPWPHVTVYSFTPDDLHIYSISTRPKGIDSVEYHLLDDALIKPGLSCTFNGQVLEYVDESHLKFNGRSVRVEDSSDYCHKPLKTRILGLGAAKGVFQRLENIAEEGKHTDYPFWRNVWTGLFNFYAPI